MQPVRKQKPEPPDDRPFIELGDALTLAGMVVVVISLFMTWRRVLPPASVIPAGSLVRLHPVRLDAFALGVWLPVTLFATGAAVTVIWRVTPKNRAALVVVQLLLSLGCAAVPLLWFKLLPGPLMALAGAALLVAGALLRASAQAARQPA